jgi:hypothetical protein
MSTNNLKANPDWREFEQLVARIEADAGPLGLVVVSPDRIRCKITGKMREVDASVRTKVGTENILITIECRKRRPKQDVTWIEQLATKKTAIGASATIAVSSSGFSEGAITAARHHGIDLRRLSELSASEINKLMRIDFVLFTHKKCSLARVALRFYRDLDWQLPNLEQHPDCILPKNTDVFRPILKNIDTGTNWSLNDLWLQLQDATDPFVDIVKGEKPVIRTACFPYPGNVVIETPEGEKILGDVLLSVALSLDVEKVDLESAQKVKYECPDGEVIQRVEFISQESGERDYSLSLQMPEGSENLSRFKARIILPKESKSKNSG